jgi:4-aminobutyrate aminotransferase-like enzyme
MTLYNDERVVQAKAHLIAALKEANAKIGGVRPPKEAYKETYDAYIKTFNTIRGAPLFFPYLGSTRGNGVFVELLDESVKFDLISGIGVHYMGHSNPLLIPALVDALLSDIVMQGNLQQNKIAFDFASLLTQLAKVPHCFLSSSGSMACENALKICFQKNYPASRVLAFEKCFAGRSLALATITDKPLFRQGLPAALPVDYIPFYDYTAPEESTKRSIQTLKKHIARYPKQHAVMCLELVQGEGGFWTAPREFFLQIIHVLKEAGIAVWADEIQTFARCESLFAFQYYGLEEYVDVISLGKASLCCATLFREAFCPKPGLLGQTFTAATSAIAAGMYTIRYAIENGFFGPNGKIAKLHYAFVEGLKKFEASLLGPYGIGAMIACTPYGGEEEKVRAFARRLFDNGVISFIAGASPTRIRFLLPVGALELEHIDPIMQIIGKSI